MATEIKALTSARGIAATLVMVYHFHQMDNIASVALLSFIKKGYLWVDFFFILSGFVMAMTYRTMFAGKYSWRHHREFLLRRIGRIYPMYIFVTLCVSFYSLAVYGGFSGVHRPAVNLENPILAHITNIFMIHAWGFGDSIGGPTWSISTEWAAYLLFPILIYLALFSGWLGALSIALLSAIALFFVATTTEVGQTVRNGGLDIFHGRDALTLLRCLGGFCLGLLVFRASQMLKAKAVFYSDIFASLVIILLAAMMAMNADDLLIYPLLVLLVLSLYGNVGKVSALLSTPVFYMLGVLSYSIYLLHHHFFVALQQLQLRLPAYMPETAANILAAFIVYSTVIGGAYFCYNFIEKPSRNWFRKFSG